MTDSSIKVLSNDESIYERSSYVVKVQIHEKSNNLKAHFQTAQINERSISVDCTTATCYIVLTYVKKGLR